MDVVLESTHVIGRIAWADDERAVVAVVKQAMASLDEGCIERDDIHFVPESQLFSGDDSHRAKFRRDEQLTRVISRFPVNVDGSGEIGSVCIIVPVVVREPAVGLGEGDQFATSRVVQLKFGWFNDGLNPGNGI